MKHPGKRMMIDVIHRPDADSLSELSEFKVMEWLFWLRNLMVLAQFSAIVVAVKFMGISLPVWQLGMAPLMLFFFNLLVYWRLEAGRSVSESEIMLQLLVDMLVFTWLLYWTGGSANPFVSAYLVPVAVAAAFGSLRHALVLGLISVALYSFLMVRYVPLPSMNGRFGGDFSLHVFGMWLSFLLSAAITISFVSGLARLARRREIALKQAEQESINSQHLVTLGALAAGAAHELATPLSNISMLADELVAAEGDDQERTELVNLLKEQLGLCQSQISLLRDQASHAQNPEVRIGSVAEFIHGIFERFRAMRSEMVIKISEQPLHGEIEYDPGLSQTLLNVLNNAADASFENERDLVEINYHQRDSELVICIDDFGVGLSVEQLELAGKVPFSTKHAGMGIGLLLSQANINRMGGSLCLNNRAQPADLGVRTEVIIPISNPERNS
jgi:two-component system sensor histidine kinase RegB